ncbi:MAG TPA: hypothetical protein PK948_00115 [Gemmatimonadales bacterium]|nr:hypothetical protein [Gemmatimonadales bacterium]
MWSHFLGFLALAGASLLALLGLGIGVFALARGNRRLAGRALFGTGGLVLVYLAATAAFALLTPRRVLPLGQELHFCGFDCHLHVSVLGSESEDDRVGVTVRLRSDAKQEPEYPQYLEFRLVGVHGEVAVPESDFRGFLEPLAAGQSHDGSIFFNVPATGYPYSLRVTYPGLIDALLLGPANSRAQGKTTLGLGDTPQ